MDNLRNSDQDTLIVPQCTDFEIDGKGTNSQWNNARWLTVPILDNTEKKYETKVKMLYSSTGIYVLAHCEDEKITTDYTEDQGDIWEGDVFEIFLQTDPENPLYFEYEINPLGTELVLLIPNNKGVFFGWQPWHYEGDRVVKRKVHIEGGEMKNGAKINGWTAELFFPYKLFRAFKNVPPSPGMEWKGNFTRMDYDSGERIKWSWAPIEFTFHEYEKFKPIIFK